MVNLKMGVVLRNIMEGGIYLFDVNILNVDNCIASTVGYVIVNINNKNVNSNLILDLEKEKLEEVNKKALEIANDIEIYFSLIHRKRCLIKAPLNYFMIYNKYIWNKKVQATYSLMYIFFRFVQGIGSHELFV